MLKDFRKRFLGKRPALFKSGQWHFQQDNAPVHNSILVTDYLIKMGIKTAPHPSHRPDLALCDLWLFPKLRGCRYKTIEEIKEAVTKVIDTLTQEDLHGAFLNFLERYNTCIAAGWVYFEGDKSFILYEKHSGNLFDDPRIYVERYKTHIIFFTPLGILHMWRFWQTESQKPRTFLSILANIIFLIGSLRLFQGYRRWLMLLIPLWCIKSFYLFT